MDTDYGPLLQVVSGQLLKAAGAPAGSDGCPQYKQSDGMNSALTNLKKLSLKS